MVLCSFIRRHVMSGFCGVGSCWYSMPRSFHCDSLNSVIYSSFINWNIFIVECYDSYTIWTPSGTVHIGKDRLNTSCPIFTTFVETIYIPCISPTGSVQLNSFFSVLRVCINIKNFHYRTKKPHTVWPSLPILPSYLFWAFSINGIYTLCGPLWLATFT